MSRRVACGGFTLFEVILSLAIVGGAMAVISQIVWSGLESARMTQELVQAELLAENVMAELLAEIRPLEPTTDSPFEEDDSLEDPEQWVFSVDIEPLEMEGLLEVTVTVHPSSDKPRRVEYSLVRWLWLPEEEASDIDTTELP